MTDELEYLFNQCYSAFSSHEAWSIGKELMYGELTCLGRHTVTGMLTASGKQFNDWTSAYRLFSKQRVDVSGIFRIVQENTLKETNNQQYIVAHMDDTIVKKTGKRIPGTAWRRDPLGPRFHTNFIWGQRFIQLSLALPQEGNIGQSRAIPVDFHHCPSVVKPKKTATEEQIVSYKEEKKIAKLSHQGISRISLLRDSLNKQGYGHKELVVGVDGSYTNKEVLKNIPQNTTIIGRIRKDTKLYSIPEVQPNSGRKRVYGERIPTPEEIRQSDNYPWVQEKAWAAGKTHTFNLKVIPMVRWRSAGNQNLKLIIIRPLGYRLTKNSKILYREPSYLICTDTELTIQNLLQAYLWRWEIEVDFREEKTLLGCGQAQVRNINSIESLPAFVAATYGLLLIASHRAEKIPDKIMLPRPKWYPKKENSRITTGDLLNNLRAQLWKNVTKMNFSGFMDAQNKTRSFKNKIGPNEVAAFYVRN